MIPLTLSRKEIRNNDLVAQSLALEPGFKQLWCSLDKKSMAHSIRDMCTMGLNLRGPALEQLRDYMASLPVQNRKHFIPRTLAIQVSCFLSFPL